LPSGAPRPLAGPLFPPEANPRFPRPGSFQSYEDRKWKINPDDKAELSRARTEGRLHESLLDRREKMKADRFCK
jgi:hypothetical protein